MADPILCGHQVDVSIRSNHLTVMVMNITGIEWLVTAVRTVGGRPRIRRILEFVVRNAIAGRYVIVMVMMMIECAKITHFTRVRLGNRLNC